MTYWGVELYPDIHNLCSELVSFIPMFIYQKGKKIPGKGPSPSGTFREEKNFYR
jgi:hypothetical protein